MLSPGTKKTSSDVCEFAFAPVFPSFLSYEELMRTLIDRPRPVNAKRKFVKDQFGEGADEEAQAHPKRRSQAEKFRRCQLAVHLFEDLRHNWGAILAQERDRQWTCSRKHPTIGEARMWSG